MKFTVYFLLISILLFAGVIPFGEIPANKSAYFESISSRKSGVSFNNKLTEDKSNNILTYEYFYNGGGVAVGDFNNDGLEDIFFTGNMTENKLYLNLGDFKFRDITKSAGVGGKKSWTTGVSVVDINGDGLLDIYVCYSGNGNLDSRRNELFINQGDLTFVESAKDYGLDDPSNSTQALFFDFDNDGDLDLYLLNHHIEVINEIEFDDARQKRHPFAGDKLYRNDGGKFTDITQEAGIKGSALGFGLGVVASDLNGDGWIDLYVSNDYIEPDYLYINNGDGTFSDRLPDYLQHISHFSMGLDIADMNNDGLPDIFTLDMLPEDNKRQKLLYGPENYEQYALMVNRGFYHQNMRNMLHLNHGEGMFSEIGQLSGISNTDWSWSALFFDADNDGHKDLFVTNGYYRDYTNRDFLKYKGDYYFKTAVAGEKADTLHLVTSMSSTPISNYFFGNTGNLTFQNHTRDAGLHQPNFSSGAVYADLNNDGKLDLIVNNINQAASIYRNNHPAENYFIKVKLEGNSGNTSGIGSKVTVYTSEGNYFQEQSPVRGFQSSVSTTLHFGLGGNSKIDSIKVIWPGGKSSVIQNPKVNTTLSIKENEASMGHQTYEKPKPIFTNGANPIPYRHEEYGFNDFKREPMLLEMPSYIGPIMAAGDVSGNGLEEVFVGGTKGYPGKMFRQENGEWKTYSVFESDEEFTDASAVFFDADGDGLLDLYIASGGYHDYLSSDESLQDRLYLNDGQGNLKISADKLPRIRSSASKVVSFDFDGDGHLDLFVAGRIVPGKYPESPKSILLLNDGRGNFSDISEMALPEGGKLGMIRDVAVLDLNGNGRKDLILAGEYTPIIFLENTEGEKFQDKSLEYLPDNPLGWWTKLEAGDFNNDGKMDVIAGNFGLNSQFNPSSDEPLSLYFGDFDDNSSIDPILSYFIQGKEYPFPSRDELLDQMYSMRSKFTDYESYANATIEKVLGKEGLKKASILKANELRSMVLINNGGLFEATPLPIEAQFAPVYAIQVLDFDEDGNPDLLLAGNQSQIRLRLGVIDASYGQLFRGKGDGEFDYIDQQKSGLRLYGDVKSIVNLPSQPKKYYFGVNNGAIQAIELNP
ncbi:VCBS repeat-containing protein [Arthrospiribacter ruber]|uniref:RNA-binding protein n=1 Tax=Arthrospiribacter ruber TaxID=2487934 RepID=A0A951IV86_9BACT|nr:VCBS repeat-containing protein [Arthrospiribacter ruber]MBW3466489.1 RNA-binding protein [Arthrospiribacter ruber]